MKYSLGFSKQVIKFLKKHPELKKRIVAAMTDITENPSEYIQSKYDIVKLKNLEDYYRLRIGKYRIIYNIVKGKLLIWVVRADSRGDIYKKKK